MIMSRDKRGKGKLGEDREEKRESRDNKVLAC